MLTPSGGNCVAVRRGGKEARGVSLHRGNTNRVQGGAIWVSLLKKAKPVTVNRVVT